MTVDAISEVISKLETERNNCERCLCIAKAIQSLRALRAIPRKRGAKLRVDSARGKIEEMINCSINCSSIGATFTPKIVSEQLHCSKRMAYNQLANFATTGILKRIRSGVYVKAKGN